MSGTHSGPLKSCSGLAGSSAQVFFFLLWWIPGVLRCPDLWCSGGGRPFPVDTFRKPHLPLPFASKMDSPLPLLRLPCHHPSRPPALPPAHGLPSRGLAGGGSGGGGGSGVRQSPRLPDGEPPPPKAPQVAGRPPAPQAQAALCLVWGRGAVPGPRSCWPLPVPPSARPPWSPHTACIVCEARKRRSRPVWFSAWPCAARPSGPSCVCRKEWA